MKHGWPPYFAYQLEGKCEEKSLSFSKLKGDDFRRISALVNIAKELGLEILLGALVRSLHEDSDGPCSDPELSVDITKVVNLYGQRINADPSCDKWYTLNVEELDECVSHDESEHDRHSDDYRRHGESITRWYRNTLVFIVPKTERTTFITSNNMSYRTEELMTLYQAALSSETAKYRLHQTCQMLVAVNSCSSQDFDLIASIVLEHDWLELSML